MYQDLTLLASIALIYSCIAGRVDRSWLTGPILFIATGFAVGPLGLHWLSFQANAETIRWLAEITLALVLFSDAASADLPTLRKSSFLPLRMLLIGLPITLAFSFGAGIFLFPHMSWYEVALLATILAPTDAALGQAVLKNHAVPANFRAGLNAESGLNDGICVPVLLLFLTLSATESAPSSSGQQLLALQLMIEEIGIGMLVGGVSVCLAVALIRGAQNRGWLTPDWMQVPVVGLAIVCFSAAQSLHGSGFIAAFCGGLLFAYFTKQEREPLLVSAEATGDTFSLLTWVLFGATVLGQSFENLTWQILVYALLSLTVLRMLPVFLCLIGTGISTEGRLFLGWFGPRGLASIVFVVMVIDTSLPHTDDIATVVALTILLSVIAHGVTAAPWASRWRRKGVQSPSL